MPDAASAIKVSPVDAIKVPQMQERVVGCEYLQKRSVPDTSMVSEPGSVRRAEWRLSRQNARVLTLSAQGAVNLCTWQRTLPPSPSLRLVLMRSRAWRHHR